MEYHRLSSSGRQHIQELVKVSVQFHLLWANASLIKHKFSASLPLTLTQSHCSVVKKKTLNGASRLKFWICEGFYMKWRKDYFQHILRTQFSDVYFPKHRENHWNFEYHESYEWKVFLLFLSVPDHAYEIFFSALNTPGHFSTNDSLNTYKESSHLEFGTFLCWQLSVSMKYWLERKEIHSPHVVFCKLNWSFATSTTGYVFTMGKYYTDIILPEQHFLN